MMEKNTENKDTLTLELEMKTKKKEKSRDIQRLYQHEII